MCGAPWPAGVLSEEQIRLKKMKKQHEEDSARTSSVATPTPPPAEPLSLGPEQQDMIDKLVAMQKQCNKRSFIDRPKVTVRPCVVILGVGRDQQTAFSGVLQ